MKCAKCGRKNAWQSEFCSGCGGALEPPAPPARPEQSETGAESWRWIAIWSLVVFAIVAGLCIYAFQPEGHYGAGHGPDPTAISGVGVKAGPP
ncbi:MAG TPA: hypothetical protein VFJ58_21090 [Armatimonadota bacterium]|nr:hypothetical protein [Armatimonadota bacterium]